MTRPWADPISLGLGLCLVACRTAEPSNTESDRAAAASARAATSTGPSAPSAAPQVADWYEGHWEGSYEAATATPSAEPGFGIADWAKKSAQGIGTGKLSVSIDRSGTADGTAEGALGSQSIRGAVDGASLRLAARPVGSAVQGFSGVIVLARGYEDSLTGTLRASGENSRLVRHGSVQLRKH